MRKFQYMMSLFSKLIGLVRLTPFDVATPEGRSSERYRRIMFSAMSSFSASGVSFVISIISVPLVFNYLGAERYGLWVTLSAIIALFSFMDFGIGNSLVNAIADSSGRDNQSVAIRYISSAFVLLLLLTVVFGFGFMVVYPFLNWGKIFTLSSSNLLQDAKLAFLSLFIFFLLSMFLGIVQKIQSGFQQGYLNGIWRNVGNIFGVLFLFIAIKLRAGLPWLILAFFGAPVLAIAVNFILFFGFRHPSLRPNGRAIDSKSIGYLLRLGGLYFVLQAAGAIGFQTDIIIVARLLGPVKVADYSISAKLFSYIPLLAGLVIAPLWPAYAEAASRKDFAWIQNTLQKSILMTLIGCGPLLLLMAMFGGQIIHIWIGPQVHTSPFLLFSLALWNLLHSVSIALAVYFNGLSIIKFQVVLAGLMGITNIILSIFLVGRIGPAGAVWGSIISFVICILIPYLIYISRNEP